MKVISWNVNSVRTRAEHVRLLLQNESPDVLMLQETKVVDELFPFDAFDDFPYNIAIRGQKAYCGVAIFSKNQIEDVDCEFCDEARFIKAFISGVNIINVYVPQGQELGCDKYFFKLRFLDDLIAKITEYASEKTVLAGDFNIAMRPQDSHKPDFTGNICSAPERERMQRIVDAGYTDIVHDLGFTWWGYMAGALRRNIGFRIDNIFASHAMPPVLAYDVLKSYRELERPSDHAPVMVRFAEAA